MYINTFKYTPKDVSCQLCTEYVKKLGCTALRCPWLAERIEAGVVGYREAVLETFPHERRLFQRLNLLIKHYPGSLWSNEQHERRMQYQCAVQGYDRAFHILAITVCQADWDRRYSPDNRAWANALSIPANPDAWGTDRNCYLAVSSHPGLVDLFLSQTRKAYAQERQKTSVRDMLKKLPETTSPKISAKSKAPER